jgi:hypothetical protein
MLPQHLVNGPGEGAWHRFCLGLSGQDRRQGQKQTKKEEKTGHGQVLVVGMGLARISHKRSAARHFPAFRNDLCEKCGLARCALFCLQNCIPFFYKLPRESMGSGKEDCFFVFQMA